MDQRHVARQSSTTARYSGDSAISATFFIFPLRHAPPYPILPPPSTPKSWDSAQPFSTHMVARKRAPPAALSTGRDALLRVRGGTAGAGQEIVQLLFRLPDGGASSPSEPFPAPLRLARSARPTGSLPRGGHSISQPALATQWLDATPFLAPAQGARGTMPPRISATLLRHSCHRRAGTARPTPIHTANRTPFAWPFLARFPVPLPPSPFPSLIPPARAAGAPT